jgi:para-aminobenzoate synthetase component 1
MRREIKLNAGTALQQLQDFIDQRSSWLFGHLAYDLKNEIEDLGSLHTDHIGFPDLYFFEPEIIIRITNDQMIIESNDPADVFRQLNDYISPLPTHPDPVNIEIEQRLSREQYIAVINKLKEHILRGDSYEINFCQEFFAKEMNIDPLEIYRRLSTLSPNPFSALYRQNEHWLLCASPERFLKRIDSKIISQPIKGTSKRNRINDSDDEESRRELAASEKDRAENVMIVDLVRNDLARICKEGTVRVDELFGIYSFPQVHQMISTISGQLRPELSFSEILRATFPMGSMTGAPKKRVMELIEQYEVTRRGIFSGALGYMAPWQDLQQGPVEFDFNVVIRSIMYNASSKYLSFQAGSGITFYSDAEKEWEECMIKAAAMKAVLQS